MLEMQDPYYNPGVDEKASLEHSFESVIEAAYIMDTKQEYEVSNNPQILQMLANEGNEDLMSKLSLTNDASDGTDARDSVRQRLKFARENRRRNYALAQVDSQDDDEIVERDNAEEVLEDDPSENFFFVGPRGPPGPPGFVPPMPPRMHPQPIYVPPPPPRFGPYTPNNPDPRGQRREPKTTTTKEPTRHRDEPVPKKIDGDAEPSKVPEKPVIILDEKKTEEEVTPKPVTKISQLPQISDGWNFFNDKKEPKRHTKGEIVSDETNTNEETSPSKTDTTVDTKIVPGPVAKDSLPCCGHDEDEVKKDDDITKVVEVVKDESVIP